MHKYRDLGFGLGLRSVHYQTILETIPRDIDWFEIITEDYLVPGGNPLYYLERIREHYPVVMHGVSLSIGSTDPLNFYYLDQIKALADRIQPEWISDHVCWTGVDGINLHDLMPLPYTRDVLKHLVTRVQQVQDYLGRQILLENPSTYITFQDSEMNEWQFMSELAKQADCLLLLDVNNVYVSSFNHNFDRFEYINHILKDRVQQIHLAGHENCGTHIIDTHDHAIIDEVWELYAYTMARLGRVSTMIERDANIPPLQDLIDELAQAKKLAQRAWASQKNQHQQQVVLA